MANTATDALTKAGLNLIQQALSVFDSDLKLVHVNRSMIRMFDLPDHLVAPGTGFDAVIRFLVQHGEYGPIDNFNEFVEARVALAKTFEPHYMERTRANGRTISVEGAPLPQGGWVTVYTDITQVKAQEELLRAHSEVLNEEVLHRSEQLAASNRKLAATNAALDLARTELAEMEARARLTAEMMPAHIAHVDSDARYTYSNRRLTSVIPGRPSQIVGLHISEALGPAFASVKPHFEAAQSGLAATFEFTDDASSRRIRVVFTPDEVGRGVYILSMDVTKETQARVALQQTRRREIAAQLTSGLAHDFSNLLTVILGLQSRLQDMDLGDEAAKLITATRAAATRGGGLLHRIADMTTARGYRPQVCHLTSLFSELEILASPSLPAGVELKALSQTDGHFLLDAGRLQDSLLNLVLNARDACSKKGHINVSAREVMDTWLEIAVTDTGPGFSPEALIHGIDPFFTTKGANGSGLGLAMVYDTCKLAGGTVTLVNDPDGARVTLRVPLQRANKTPDPDMVLLVEDNPDLRDQIRKMLTQLGHTVIEASSVTEALDLARTIPDIAQVLSDLRLEGTETGLELLDHLSDIPIRFMTSLPAEDPLTKAAAHAAPLLKKPFDIRDLQGFLQTSQPGIIS
jgi:signal transduction histidine kinase/CheY-like chemotaxis protein